jgi:putative Mg2+ transporter-C (MgtC) family protein
MLTTTGTGSALQVCAPIVLVAVGGAVFVDMANRLGDREGAVHLMAYVVSGIGFLGAGVIIREEGNVRGINTAAMLWGSAAVGAAAGAELILESVIATLFVLAANTFLRAIVWSIKLDSAIERNLDKLDPQMVR